MSKRDDSTGSGRIPEMTEGEERGEVVSRPAPPRVEKKRRKVSLIAAIVVNVVTLLTLAIILLAVLLPGYRRSFTMARAVKGSEDVWILVRTSEATIRENNTDFNAAQDGLKNALQELVESGGDNVRSFVRDNFPDQAWINDNLPENMRQWLEQLYPKLQDNQEDGKSDTPAEDGQEQPAEEVTS